MSLDAVKDWSTNATLNTTLGSSLTLDGTVMKPSDVDNAFRELMAQVAAQFGKINFKGADIASATPNLAAATGNFVDITGTTTIAALGTVAAGQVFFLRFTGVLTFTYNGTSLIIPGAANILTAIGDIACMLSLGSGNWLCAALLAGQWRRGLPYRDDPPGRDQGQWPAWQTPEQRRHDQRYQRGSRHCWPDGDRRRVAHRYLD